MSTNRKNVKAKKGGEAYPQAKVFGDDEDLSEVKEEDDIHFVEIKEEEVGNDALGPDVLLWSPKDNAVLENKHNIPDLGNGENSSIPVYLSQDEHGTPFYIRHFAPSVDEMFVPSSEENNPNFDGFSVGSGSTFEGFSESSSRTGSTFEGFSESSRSSVGSSFEGFSEASVGSSFEGFSEASSSNSITFEGFNEGKTGKNHRSLIFEGVQFHKNGNQITDDIKDEDVIFVEKREVSVPVTPSSGQRKLSKKTSLQGACAISDSLPKKSKKYASKRSPLDRISNFFNISPELHQTLERLRSSAPNQFYGKSSRRDSAPSHFYEKSSRRASHDESHRRSKKGLFYQKSGLRHNKNSHPKTAMKMSRSLSFDDKRQFIEMEKRARRISREIMQKQYKRGPKLIGIEASPQKKNLETSDSDADISVKVEEEFIGEYCNAVGCTISWLENMQTKCVTVNNGIVCELDQFAKSIAWEKEHVAKWILRLNGIDNVEPSEEDLDKIHLVVKRQKALSVTLGGQKSCSSRLSEFYETVFILPSCLKTKDDTLKEGEYNTKRSLKLLDLSKKCIERIHKESSRSKSKEKQDERRQSSRSDSNAGYVPLRVENSKAKVKQYKARQTSQSDSNAVCVSLRGENSESKEKQDERRQTSQSDSNAVCVSLRGENNNVKGKHDKAKQTSQSDSNAGCVSLRGENSKSKEKQDERRQSSRSDSNAGYVPLRVENSKLKVKQEKTRQSSQSDSNAMCVSLRGENNESKEKQDERRQTSQPDSNAGSVPLRGKNNNVKGKHDKAKQTPQSDSNAGCVSLRGENSKSKEKQDKTRQTSQSDSNAGRVSLRGENSKSKEKQDTTREQSQSDSNAGCVSLRVENGVSPPSTSQKDLEENCTRVRDSLSRKNSVLNRKREASPDEPEVQKRSENKQKRRKWSHSQGNDSILKLYHASTSKQHYTDLDLVKSGSEIQTLESVVKLSHNKDIAKDMVIVSHNKDIAKDMVKVSHNKDIAKDVVKVSDSKDIAKDVVIVSHNKDIAKDVVKSSHNRDISKDFIDKSRGEFCQLDRDRASSSVIHKVSADKLVSHTNASATHEIPTEVVNKVPIRNNESNSSLLITESSTKTLEKSEISSEGEVYCDGEVSSDSERYSDEYNEKGVTFSNDVDQLGNDRPGANLGISMSGRIRKPSAKGSESIEIKTLFMQTPTPCSPVVVPDCKTKSPVELPRSKKKHNHKKAKPLSSAVRYSRAGAYGREDGCSNTKKQTKYVTNYVRRMCNMSTSKVSFSLKDNHIVPHFKEVDYDLGECCRAAGITVDVLNADTPFNVILTKGLVQELSRFYTERSCPKISLVVRLCKMKERQMVYNKILATVIKITKLSETNLSPADLNTEFTFPQKIRKNFDELSESAKKNRLRALAKAKQLKVNEKIRMPGMNETASKSKKKFLRDEVCGDASMQEFNKKYDTNERISGKKKKRSADHKGKADTTPLENAKQNFGITEKTDNGQSNIETSTTIPVNRGATIDHCIINSRGKDGSITRGDIVYLYTQWLKNKMKTGSSVFVTDLLKAVEQLMAERKVDPIRIPAGTLMSSSVKLYEEYKQMQGINREDAAMYLEEDWLEDIQYLVSLAQPSRRSTTEGEGSSIGKTDSDSSSGKVDIADDNEDADCSFTAGGNDAYSSEDSDFESQPRSITDETNPSYKEVSSKSPRGRRLSLSSRGRSQLLKSPSDVGNRATLGSSPLKKHRMESYATPGSSSLKKHSMESHATPGSSPLKKHSMESVGKRTAKRKYIYLSDDSDSDEITTLSDDMESPKHNQVDKILDHRSTSQGIGNGKQQHEYLGRRSNSSRGNAWVTEKEIADSDVDDYWINKRLSPRRREAHTPISPRKKSKATGLSPAIDQESGANSSLARDLKAPTPVSPRKKSQATGLSPAIDQESGANSSLARDLKSIGTGKENINNIINLIVREIMSENNASKSQNIVTKRELLNVYDRWRIDNQRHMHLSGSKVLKVQDLVKQVRELMASKKVNFKYPEGLLNACFLMTQMKLQLRSDVALNRYLDSDCFGVLELSSKQRTEILAKYNFDDDEAKKLTMANLQKKLQSLHTDMVISDDEKVANLKEYEMVKEGVEGLEEICLDAQILNPNLVEDLQQQISVLKAMLVADNPKRNDQQVPQRGRGTARRGKVSFKGSFRGKPVTPKITPKKSIVDRTKPGVDQAVSDLSKCGIPKEKLDGVLDLITEKMQGYKIEKWSPTCRPWAPWRPLNTQ